MSFNQNLLEHYVERYNAGPDSDWVKNVRARGTAVIIHGGSEPADEPASRTGSSA